MYKKLISSIKPLLKSLVLLALVVGLAFGHSSDALAASRGGGRMGGGSFRAPSRSFSSPSRSYSAPRSYAPGGGYPGGGYPGGGFGFPFYIPMFFGGGGSLFTVLIFIAIASFLVQSFRRSRAEGVEYDTVINPSVNVTRVQVGMLASARELQADLDKLAIKADTGSSAGLANLLQETTLAVLRHPEYWTHASSTIQQARLEAAEAQFNRLVLTERSKFSRETLSNVNSQLKQAPMDAVIAGSTEDGALTEAHQAPGEFIVVTLLAATQGNLNVPTINSPEDLRKTLSVLGGVSSDRLLALEILWTPQAAGDVLTRDDLLVEYPDLKLI
jgi:uncharacterized membrane protein